MLELRPYQRDAANAVVKEWRGGRKRTLLVLCTGAGKTIIFSNIAKWCVSRGERVLVLAHRDELLQQAADKMKSACGLDSGLEKAKSTTIGSGQSVVVASVQTMQNENRLVRFSPGSFDTIIVDEAHHAMSDSYRKVLDHFPGAKVLGVTATPDRGDKKNLADYFESIAFEYSMRDAVRDGYLCPIKAQMIPLQIDMSTVKVSRGDFLSSQAARAIEPYLEKIADEMANICMNRKTVVFMPLVAISQKFRDILNERGFRAAEVNGKSRDRQQTLLEFEHNRYNVLVNAMLLCLDMDTEILTERGFVGPDEIRGDDLVANWNFDGSVFFEKPHEIVRRPLGESEHMVGIHSRTVDIRVTDTHRMVVKGGADSSWRKVPAGDLKGYMSVPSCGEAEPLDAERFKKVPPSKCSMAGYVCAGEGEVEVLAGMARGLAEGFLGDPCRTLMSLSPAQFRSFLEGAWRRLGNAAHNGKMPSCISFQTRDRRLADAVCAVGSVRGWRCRMRPGRRIGSVMIFMDRKPESEIWYKADIEHEAYSPEEVWCVRTTSKNIITRRNGVVTVMGNTEGWDCPSVDCIVMLRPTKIRSLFVQAVGRGTRLFPGKDHLLLLDFLWMTERHDLCRPSTVFGSTEGLRKAMDRRMESTAGLLEEPLDLMEVAKDAERDVVEERETALANQLEALRNRKRKMVDPLQFSLSIMDGDLADYKPMFKWETEKPTDSQKEFLEKRGIDPAAVKSRGHASVLVDRLIERQKAGLSTPKQIRLLERNGFQRVGEWSFADASGMISRMAERGWTVPREVDPATYVPGK